MANDENLKPLTTSQAREIGSKGGKASVKAKRERKAMKEQMLMLLSLPMKEGNTKQSLRDMGISDDELNNQMALIASTWKQAMKGNINAVNTIREMIGERVMEINVSQTVDDRVKELNKLLEDE